MTSQEQIDALLAELWERNRPLLEERLTVLDRAVAEVNAGALDEATRIEALDTTHKLAGTLGIFGSQRGTELAREMEKILGQAEVSALARLPELVADLRETLESRLSS